MATQQAPWASGKHKPGSRKGPMSNAGRSGLGRVAANAKKGWKKTLRKHPMVGMLLSVLLGILAVVSLILGVFLESALYYLVMALAGLGSLAIRRAQQMERTRQGVPPKPSSAGPRTPHAPPPPPTPGPGPKPGDVVKCTRSGKPTGDCDCARVHVATQAGVKRYGRPLGTPIGKKPEKKP